MSNGSAFGLLRLIGRRFAGLAVMGFAMACVLSACVYVPEGATVVEIKNIDREFDRAELRSVDALRASELIRMKWYDTNTYITTATLTPGKYRFLARSYDGIGLQREIDVVAGTNRYTVDGGRQEPSESGDEASGGPALTGKIVSTPARRMPVTVAVLFIGERVEMRDATVERDGSFSTEFPRAGVWRVEVHATGTPPFSYVRAAQQVNGAVDLGNIALQ